MIEQAALPVAREFAPSAVVLGGGGYNPWTLGRAWAGLWAGLSGQEIPKTLPPEAQAVLAALDCDLVDTAERDPAWVTHLADTPNPGPVRAETEALSAAFRTTHPTPQQEPA